MKRSSQILAITLLCIASTFVRAQTVCHAEVRAEIAVAAPFFSLADLLMAGTCQDLLTPAAGVRMGAVPAAGGTRVVEADYVNAALRKLIQLSLKANIRFEVGEIPARITVHGTARHRSCRDLVSGLLQGASPESEFKGLSEAAGESSKILNFDCGLANLIPEQKPLTLIKTTWDPALKEQLLFVRCLNSADCLPFLVRLRMTDGEMNSLNSTRAFPIGTMATKQPRKSLYIRSGQRATLVWEESGIRSVVAVTCLDSGGLGDSVRVRLPRQYRETIHVVVAGLNLLRKS